MQHSIDGLNVSEFQPGDVTHESPTLTDGERANLPPIGLTTEKKATIKKTVIARAFYQSNPNVDRKTAMQYLMEVVGLSKAGANTYHQNLKPKA